MDLELLFEVIILTIQIMKIIVKLFRNSDHPNILTLKFLIFCFFKAHPWFEKYLYNKLIFYSFFETLPPSFSCPSTLCFGRSSLECEEVGANILFYSNFTLVWSNARGVKDGIIQRCSFKRGNRTKSDGIIYGNPKCYGAIIYDFLKK